MKDKPPAGNKPDTGPADKLPKKGLISNLNRPFKGTETFVHKPSDMMRSSRPELFSDSEIKIAQKLKPSILEYHLETLTNRKEEYIFEDFCRNLLQVTICPNLLPQTGPTAGGDGKTDSVTYPVAPVLIGQIYWGCPNPPTSDNWAFAFSAQKTWRAKVISDMKKIAALDRKFTKVFFVSNQFIPDKQRQIVESELSKKYSIELHILDRNWIIIKIIDDHREELAINYLNISVDEKKQLALGPKDHIRQSNLDELIEKIRNPGNYYSNIYSLSLDYLYAAKLARGLERPRYEIDGLFIHARQLAAQTIIDEHIVRCGYDHAWTNFWWFDDAGGLVKIYSELESYLPKLKNADSCEQFANLLSLIRTTNIMGGLSDEDAKVSDRTKALKDRLHELSKDRNRPTNSLLAQTALQFMALQEGIGDEYQANDALKALHKCLIKSGKYIFYPAMDFINILIKMGEYIGHYSAYEPLFKKMTEITKFREGEIAEGRILYQRGQQYLQDKQYTKALEYLGHARLRLIKEETSRESIHAVLDCAESYAGLGLKWAARMEILLATHMCFRSRQTIEIYKAEALYALKTLAWLDLGLGRIGPFLAWHELVWIMVERYGKTIDNIDVLTDELEEMDKVFGCFILNLDERHVIELAELKFSDNYLFISNLALKYALKQNESLYKDFPKEWGTERQQIIKIFEELKNQPIAEHFPKFLNGKTRAYWKLESTLFNIKFTCLTRNYFGPITFAENLLGIIEAAFALAQWENLAFIVDKVDILVDIDKAGQNPPALELEKPPHPDGYKIVWKTDMAEWLGPANAPKMGDFLMQFLLKILIDITIDPLGDLEAELKVWSKQGAFSRALSALPVALIIKDTIGEEKYELSSRFKASAP